MKTETTADIRAPLRQNHVGDAQGAGVTAVLEDSSLLDIFTLVLWLICLLVGVAGLSLSYVRPHSPAKEPEPVQAENINVELTNEVSPPDTTAPPNPEQPPPPPDAVIPPEAPPLIPVARPDPTLAFPLPVEGPTREVEAKRAAHTRPAKTATATNAPAQPLTYGQGEGKQPAPDYPHEAMLARQEGAVRVLFDVAEDGHVSTAQVVGSCPFPLLNQSALHAVRDRWHFHPGPARAYEVTINFQLKQ